MVLFGTSNLRFGLVLKQDLQKNMDEKILKKFDDENAFIKVTEPSPMEGPQKAALNRKGNQKFNEGDIEGARRVFMTTGYSDGLARVGDFYKSKDRPLEALKMYWIAPDRKKSGPLVEKLAFVLQSMLHEDDEMMEKDVILEEEQEIKND